MDLFKASRQWAERPGFAQGMTWLSQQGNYTDERVKIDRAAGKILEMFEIEKEYLNTLDGEARVQMEKYLRETIYEKEMFCPACKSKLVLGGLKKYETLLDHVSDPNGESEPAHTFICVNPECEVSKRDCFWDTMGEFFSRFNPKEIKFINNNDAPFGSFQRELNAQLHSEKRHYFYIGPKKYAWTLSFNWIVGANENGEVIKKRPHIRVTGKWFGKFGTWIDWCPLGDIK
jgi:hypothetical protein